MGFFSLPVEDVQALSRVSEKGSYLPVDSARRDSGSSDFISRSAQIHVEQCLPAVGSLKQPVRERGE
jgi:hypothetical protein